MDRKRQWEQREFQHNEIKSFVGRNTRSAHLEQHRQSCIFGSVNVCQVGYETLGNEISRQHHEVSLQEQKQSLKGRESRHLLTEFLE